MEIYIPCKPGAYYVSHTFSFVFFPYFGNFKRHLKEKKKKNIGSEVLSKKLSKKNTHTHTHTHAHTGTNCTPGTNCV